MNRARQNVNLYSFALAAFMGTLISACSGKKEIVVEPISAEPLFIERMQSGDSMVIFLSDNHIYTNRRGSTYFKQTCRFILFQGDSELYMKGSYLIDNDLFPERIEFARFMTDKLYFNRFFNDNTYCSVGDKEYTSDCFKWLTNSDYLDYKRRIDSLRIWEKGDARFGFLVKDDYMTKFNERESYRSLKYTVDWFESFEEFIVHYKGEVKRFYHVNNYDSYPFWNHRINEKEVVYGPGEKKVPWNWSYEFDYD